jgi:hypothetical protein
VALKLRVEVLTVRLVTVVPVTTRVTVAVSVPVAVLMETVPVHVVPEAIPDGLTEIVKVVFDGLAMKVLFGDRVSQVLLQAVPCDAWALALVLVCAVTIRVCEAGLAPPATAL